MNPKMPIFALSVALLATVCASAVEPHGARNGTFEDLFGKKNEEFLSKNLDEADAKLLPPFVERGAASSEKTYGCVTFDSSGFCVHVIGRCGRKVKALEDAGGAVAVMLRDGVEDAAPAWAPLDFVYDMAPRPQPPPAAPVASTVAVVGNEEKNLRGERTRFRFTCPLRYVDGGNVPPSASFHALPDGWRLTFSWRWEYLYERIPFARGRFPVSWRLVVVRTRPDGTRAMLGSPSEPLTVSWKPSQANKGDGYRFAIAYQIFTGDLGSTLNSWKGYFHELWSVSYTEGDIGYLNPGFASFEPRNPEADADFLKTTLGPYNASFQKLGEVLHFGGKEGPPKPPICSMPESYRDEVYQMTPRIQHYRQGAEALRRDYVLARFLGLPPPMPVPPPPPGQAKAKPKAKPKKAGDASWDDLDGGAVDIDLDDISF